MISPEATQTLGLAMHELVTNALKYGALSRDGGKVAVFWNILATSEAARFQLAWIETCPCPLDAPARRGFGRTVLERVVPTSLEGKITLDFTSGGLQWRLAPAGGPAFFAMMIMSFPVVGFPRHVVDDVEDPKPPTAGQLVVDEIQGPASVGDRLDEDRRPRSRSAPPRSPRAHR